MKTAVLIVTFAVSALLLAGCTTDPCATGCCGELKANCCGWEFYKPCHRKTADCGDDTLPCTTQVELAPCAPAEEAPAEEAPAEAVMEDVTSEAPSADYGLPPATR